MLLLRAAAGCAGVIQGLAYFAGSGNPALAAWLIGFLLAASGAALLIGLLTPAACVLIAAATVAIAFSWFPSPGPNLFHSPLAAVFMVTIAIALAFLGPGALSVDCRLFGRREVIIPQAPRSRGL